MKDLEKFEVFELSKKDIYAMTGAHTVKKNFKDAEDETFVLKGAVIYNDTDSKGVEKTIIALLSTDGIVYAGNSATVRESFNEIFDTFGAEELQDMPITIRSTPSKNNGPFFWLQV